MDGTVSRAGDGEVLRGPGREARVKTVRPELELLEYDVGPGYEGPGPHLHKRHVDAFYVLTGELAFTIGGETVPATAGAFVLVPPGVVHAFTYPGPTAARFLNIHAPETGFVELLRARGRGEERDPERYDIWDADDDHRVSESEAVLLAAGEGTRLSDRVAIKADAEELVLVDFTFDAGTRGPPPHLHRLHSDSFYLLEGELEFLLGDQKLRASAGSFVLAPAGVAHTFWNPGPAQARCLNLHAPGTRFAEYMVERPREGESRAEFLARFDTYTVDRPHPADA